jgi:hypothetical protein
MNIQTQRSTYKNLDRSVPTRAKLPLTQQPNGILTQLCNTGMLLVNQTLDKVNGLNTGNNNNASNKAVFFAELSSSLGPLTHSKLASNIRSLEPSKKNQIIRRAIEENVINKEIFNTAISATEGTLDKNKLITYICTDMHDNIDQINNTLLTQNSRQHSFNDNDIYIGERTTQKTFTH